MSKWYEVPYPRAEKAAYTGALPRPLYPPDAAPNYKPSVDGPDVIAYKRAIKRGQRWAVDDDFASLDDSFSNAFAHGDGTGNVGGSGVEGFQRQQGISATGYIGKATMTSLSWALVPDGPNKGKPLFDATAVDLLKQAWILYGGKEPLPPTPPPKPPSGETPIERVRKAITSFCEQGMGEPDWNYTQNRAVKVTVNPNGPVDSDCSGSAIQAFDYARKQTGIAVPDPAKQNWSGYGNTAYYEDDHPKVTNGQYLVGDLAHYDGHVCVCYHPGNAESADWWSFGSEPPSKRKLFYRDDFRFVVRPPLVPK